MDKKIIISGGGTGGHIFPAIAIANELKEQLPNVEILFVGANGRMEMKRVPEAGYRIIGMDMYGIRRSFSLKNLIENIKLPFRVIRNLAIAKKIIEDFKPDIVIGVGGYVSGPVLKQAAAMKIPTLIQEQNSYPGVANKLLAKKADVICTAYDNLEQFFPKNKTIKTGNPIRKDIIYLSENKSEAYSYFGLCPDKKTVAVIGGSLGAKTINESVLSFIEELSDEGIQFIWQTGESYYSAIPEKIKNLSGVKIMPFVQKMDYLYQVSDILVSRAGALSISELCVVGKPCILIPSPNVAEDHQTKNAKVLSNAGAAVFVADKDAKNKLKYMILELVENQKECSQMSEELKKMAIPEATKRIVEQAKKLLKI